MNELVERVKTVISIFTRPPSVTELHEHNTDSIQAQDSYHEFLSANGFMESTGQVLTDADALTRLHAILELPTTNAEKFALLSVLDVAIQNNGERGIASPVIGDILAVQGGMVLKGL